MANAVILGKFMPLHKGHELMIELAAKEFEQVTVIVSSDEHALATILAGISTPDLDVRHRIIKRKYSNYPNVDVLKHLDESPAAPDTDEHGTVINNQPFWDYWVNVIRLLAPDARYVVSSDRYGERLAAELSKIYRTPTGRKYNKVKWMPVDPDRELVPVSGTDIREDVHRNWKYLSKEFRRFYAKKIVVVGPESTGKSTLVKDLAAYWASPYVPEYGRILSEVKNNELTDMDFEYINTRHHNMIDYAVDSTETGLVFIDTEAFTTLLYGELYLNDFESSEHPDIESNAIWKKYDLTVLLSPVIPWDDDGTRMMPLQSEREKFYVRMKTHMQTVKSGSFEVTEIDRHARVLEVSKEIGEKLLDNPKHITYTIA